MKKQNLFLVLLSVFLCAWGLWSKGKSDRKGDENCDQFLSYLRYG